MRDTMAEAVEKTLTGVRATDANAAVIALIRLYGAAIDAQPAKLATYGPRLLDALSALGVTLTERKETRDDVDPFSEFREQLDRFGRA